MEGTRGAESPLRWPIKWYLGGHAECIPTRAYHRACSKPIVRSAARCPEGLSHHAEGLHHELSGAVVSAGGAQRRWMVAIGRTVGAGHLSDHGDASQLQRRSGANLESFSGRRTMVEAVSSSFVAAPLSAARAIHPHDGAAHPACRAADSLSLPPIT